MSELSERIARLSPEKRKALAEQLAPLSSAQARLWFLEQLEPNSSRYNMSKAVRLIGPLRGDVLERSIDEMVRRQHSLRTTVVGIEGQPYQIVSEPHPFRLKVADLTGLAREERETEAHALAGKESCDPFDLEKGPLFRALLIKVAAEEHIFLLAQHHIISDEWSIAIFIREISAMYQAFVAGQACLLPELAVQYGDYALWRRQQLESVERLVLDEVPLLRRERIVRSERLRAGRDHERGQSHDGGQRAFHGATTVSVSETPTAQPWPAVTRAR